MLLNTPFLVSNDYHLQTNRIDIWEFPLDSLPKEAHSLLNAEELARANRFYFERHRRRFTVARSILRLILSRYLHCDARQMTFHYNQYGKPQLHHAQALEFNLSHSQDLALLAVGQQFSLGIDLEFFSERPYEEIANHLFSEQELERFLALPTSLKPLAFFQIWAQKEAFIKACGMGLSYPTKRFDVSVFSPTPILVKDALYNKEWLISTFTPRVASSAALCYHPAIKEIRYAAYHS